MRTVLIAPTPPDIAAFGVRTLSAVLKRQGQDVRTLFLPGGVRQFIGEQSFRYEYEDALIEQVLDLCKDADLIGLSFMSNYVDRAIHLSQAIKRKLKAPLILGGIHPTVKPEECLALGDIVCVGEAEEALLELIDRMEAGRDARDVRNLWFRDADRVIRNPLRPLIQDLDSLPFCDFGTEGHYVYDIQQGTVTAMTKELLKKSFPLEPSLEGTFHDSYARRLTFKIMTTRGCPHHCTFCAETTLREMYPAEKYLRKRSIPNIMEELLWMKRELPFVECVFLFDDTFLVRSTEEIREFSQSYKEKIGLPFHIQASPTTVNEEKMQALVDAGLAFVEMGIQSTSDAAKTLYRRTTPTETILKAARLFKRYERQIGPPCYHIILDNPWETSRDIRETLESVLKLPRPLWLKRSSLVLYPGTALYFKAKEDGILRTEEDEWRMIYAKHFHTPQGSYPNFLMYLAGFSGFPRGLIRLFNRDGLVRLLDRPGLTPFYFKTNRLVENLIIVWKGIRSLCRGDWKRIKRYWVRVQSKTS